MKFVIKEWLKDKKACWLMLAYFVLHLVYIYVDAGIITRISAAFTEPDQLGHNLLILAIISAGMIVLSMIQSYISPYAKLHLGNMVYDRHIDHLLDADYEMYTKYSSSRIWTASGFISSITDIGSTIISVALNICSIVVTLYFMWKVGGNAVLPIIGIYVAAFFIFKFLFKKYDNINEKAKDTVHARNQETENIIGGFVEVRSFNTSEIHRKSLHDLNDKIFRLKSKKAGINSILNGSIEIVEKGGMIIAIFYAMSLLANGSINQAAAMSLVMYVIRLVNPLLYILDVVDGLSDKLSLRKDYEEISTYKNENDINGHLTLSSFDNELKVEDLSFSYDKTSNALNSINITVKKGQKIGICGVSGGGKSTLFKLLNRFYKPDSGRITIDGIDIKDITKDSYCNFIGCVHQENTIFPGTIRENILYGSPNALEVEFVEACKKANIYDFIISLPQRFETEVGPRGLKLSGGQKQRIALARLFLRNPEIILLDEATSALDNESETLIQDAIDALNGKTIITIAHRLSTIKNSDTIYVLGGSGIIESGTHDELVAKQGAYASMLK